MLEIDKHFIKRTFKIFLFSLTIMILTTVITYSIDINIKEIIKNIDSRIPDSVKESSGLVSVYKYVINNVFILPLQMLILSLIPIQFLYLFNIIYSSVLPGIVIGILIKIDIYKAITNIVSIIPHTIIEILGFCLFASALFQFNKAIRSKIKGIFKKHSTKNTSVIKTFVNVMKVYIFVVIPVIILAAFCEVYLRAFLYATISNIL